MAVAGAASPGGGPDDQRNRVHAHDQPKRGTVVAKTLQGFKRAKGSGSGGGSDDATITSRVEKPTARTDHRACAQCWHQFVAVRDARARATRH